MIRAMGLDLKPARSGIAQNYDTETGEARLSVAAAGRALPICGKPVVGGPGAPEMMCARPAGHDPMPWCGFAEIAARADDVTIVEGVSEGACCTSGTLVTR